MDHLSDVELPSPEGSDDELSLPDNVPEEGDGSRKAGPFAGQTTASFAFMEVFSMPRICPFVQQFGLRTAGSFDIHNGWNFLLAEARARCLALVRSLQPLVIMLSPPCTVFSQIQHSMKNRRRCYDEWNKTYAEGLALWKFALLIFKEQVTAGRFAIIEHPWLATSWQLAETRAVISSCPNVAFYVFDQCLLGLVTVTDKLPVRKRTRLLANLPGMPPELSTLCAAATCNHFPQSHVWLQGAEGGQSRCRAAQEYPAGLSRVIARTVAAQGLMPAGDDMDLELPEDIVD